MSRVSQRTGVVVAPSVRVMTYNTHGCVGRDRVASIDRIADVIAAYEPDVVALQELDQERARTGGVDQPRRIAERLGMTHHFHPALEIDDERYGNAILSRHPLHLERRGGISAFPLPPRVEPRGALWVRVDVDGRCLHVVTTHLGLGRVERRRQIDTLLGRQWLGSRPELRAVVLCGDFNAGGRSYVCRSMRPRFRDVQAAPSLRASRTWPSVFPLFRIDHMFVGDAIDVQRAFVPRGPSLRSASDHLPLVADLSVVESADARPVASPLAEESEPSP